MKGIVNFLFEVGMLNRTPRSGFHFLGTGNQSVAEHINRVMYIGYTLSLLEKDVDILKVLKMCLLHDLAESRVSDLNYVHQKYVEAKHREAIDDLSKTLPFGEDIKETIKEYYERKTKESILAKDADNIEWIISLKEQYDRGNTKAEDMITIAVKRLKTDIAKEIVRQMLETDSDEWFSDDDDWLVNRVKKEKR